MEIREIKCELPQYSEKFFAFETAIRFQGFRWIPCMLNEPPLLAYLHNCAISFPQTMSQLGICLEFPYIDILAFNIQLRMRQFDNVRKNELTTSCHPSILEDIRSVTICTQQSPSGKNDPYMIMFASYVSIVYLYTCPYVYIILYHSVSSVPSLKCMYSIFLDCTNTISVYSTL